MEHEKNLPQLTAPEIRVLGALIEKSKTTPEYYPMSLNALTAACNQKTSRHPVSDYSEETVKSALGSLKAMSLVATAIGAGNRTLKYKHNFNTLYDTSDAELALLCLLFLRGPQTPGELNTNVGRLYEFQSLEEVLSTLQRLSEGDTPFVKELPRRPGQKEARYCHLMGQEPGTDETPAPVPEPGIASPADLHERITTLEQELESVKADLARIMKELF